MEGGNANEKMLFVTGRNKMACSASGEKKILICLMFDAFYLSEKEISAQGALLKVTFSKP